VAIQGGLKEKLKRDLPDLAASHSGKDVFATEKTCLEEFIKLADVHKSSHKKRQIEEEENSRTLPDSPSGIEYSDDYPTEERPKLTLEDTEQCNTGENGSLKEVPPLCGRGRASREEARRCRAEDESCARKENSRERSIATLFLKRCQ